MRSDSPWDVPSAGDVAGAAAVWAAAAAVAVDAFCQFGIKLTVHSNKN